MRSARVCAAVDLDAEAILHDGWEQGTPLLALLAAVRPVLSPEAAARISNGVTTQDIVDTAMQMQTRDSLASIEVDLRRLGNMLASIATGHRSTPMIGRTFLQHARPTTFGWRAAQWLDPVGEHLAAVQVARSRCAIQLGGPVATLEEIGVNSGVAARLAELLNLRDPLTPWHGDRSPVTAVAALVGQTARTMAKIATDIALLASAEIGEIRVRSGASTSMPGKANPIDAVRAIAAADACAGAMHTVMAARPIELERGLGGWHVEWFALPLVLMTGAAAVEAVVRCVESLEIDSAAMRRHLDGADPSGALQSAGELIDRVLARHGYPT